MLKREAEERNINQPSTAPCSPAPGRRIVIIRTDNQSLPPGFFMSFENVRTEKRQNQSTSYKNHSSMLNEFSGVETAAPKQKRWSMLKSIVPFNNPGNSRPGEVTPPESVSEESLPNHDTEGSNTASTKAAGASSQPPSSPPYQPYSFKFSLEWLDRPSWPSRNRQLSPPKLPQSAQAAIEASLDPEIESETRPIDRRALLPSSKYSGRALAEWAQVVSECNGFFDRRRDEGVSASRLVETPTLNVESFRMFG